MAGVVVGGVAASVAIAASFRATLKADLARVSGRGVVLPSPFGPLEYLEGGGLEGSDLEGSDLEGGDLEGGQPPVLLVHGAGGGFDMGELMAQVLLGEDDRWIAPSRFGYLGSGVPEGAGPALQAHAFVWLLDELEIDRVAVVALSAGGPSGLHFALQYPDRISSLTLLSAGVTRVTDEVQDDADWKGRALVRLFSRDFPYWVFTKLFERQFLGIMGADAEVVRALSSEQRRWVARLIESMRPVSLRTPGVLVDHHQPLPGEAISGIRTPTLIVHAEDDGLQLFENARFAEATIPGARLLRFPSGGHLVMITEEAIIRDQVREHLRRRQPPSRRNRRARATGSFAPSARPRPGPGPARSPLPRVLG